MACACPVSAQTEPTLASAASCSGQPTVTTERSAATASKLWVCTFTSACTALIYGEMVTLRIAASAWSGHHVRKSRGC